MSNVCPCCGRKIVEKSAKPTVDKRLAQDLARAEAAIGVIDRQCTNPWLYDSIQPENHHVMREALDSERVRLAKALTDYRLLWAIYRRAERRNSVPYYEVAAETVA